jgi:hypothetical protein
MIKKSYERTIVKTLELGEYLSWFNDFVKRYLPHPYLLADGHPAGLDGHYHYFILYRGEPIVTIDMTPVGNQVIVEIQQEVTPNPTRNEDGTINGVPNVFAPLVREFKKDFISNKEDAGRKTDESLKARYLKGKNIKKNEPNLAESYIAGTVRLTYRQWRYQKEKDEEK